MPTQERTPLKFADADEDREEEDDGSAQLKIFVPFLLLAGIVAIILGVFVSKYIKSEQDMSLPKQSTTLPCPSWVGTNTTAICLTDNPLLEIGACYNASNAIAQVTCIVALKENGERRNLSDYANFQCSPGSQDKCLFNKSYHSLLNSSATVEEKFGAMPVVFRGVNSKLTGLGIILGLALLTGGAAVLVLRRVKVHFGSSLRTESRIEEPGDSLPE